MPAPKKPKLTSRPQKPRRGHKVRQFPVFLMLWLSLGLILLGYWYRSHTAFRYSFETEPPLSLNVSYNQTYLPTRLLIPAIDLDKPVTETWIKDGTWQVSDRAISHLTTSARPGQPGNIILYGHNTRAWLGQLRQVKPGDEITVEDAAGTTYAYRVSDKVTVKPSQIDVVLPTEEEILTIYTCTGFADSLRLVVQAKPISKEN